MEYCNKLVKNNKTKDYLLLNNVDQWSNLNIGFHPEKWRAICASMGGVLAWVAWETCLPGGHTSMGAMSGVLTRYVDGMVAWATCQCRQRGWCVSVGQVVRLVSTGGSHGWHSKLSRVGDIKGNTREVR